ERASALLARPLARFTATTITDGRALSKELLRIHDVGVAFDAEESVRGLVCAAAPVHTPCRQSAAVSVSAARGTDLRRITRNLKATAEMVTRVLRAQPVPVGRT